MTNYLNAAKKAARVWDNMEKPDEVRQAAYAAAHVFGLVSIAEQLQLANHIRLGLVVLDERESAVDRLTIRPTIASNLPKEFEEALGLKEEK